MISVVTMEVVALGPDLHLLRFPIGNAYLWIGNDGLTLIDCGLPGSAPHIGAAIRQLGYHPADVAQLVLTHFHPDHVGTAADVKRWGQAQVLAHRADALFITGRRTGPPPDLADWERPLFEQVNRQVPAASAEPVPVDTELDDGSLIDLGGTHARVVGVPGHTPGSIALHVFERGVLLVGDTIARAPDGLVMRGVFNADPTAVRLSVRRLAALDTEIVGFGHGDPLNRDAAATLRTVADRLSDNPR